MPRQVKGGYLLRHKKRLLGKAWREEWVVLYEDSTLAWYKEKGQACPDGALRVRDAPDLLAGAQWTLRIPGRPALPSGCQVMQLFAVATRAAKVYWLLAASSREADEWMIAISKTLPPPPPPRGPPPKNSSSEEKKPIENSAPKTADDGNAAVPPPSDATAARPAVAAAGSGGPAPAATAATATTAAPAALDRPLSDGVVDLPATVMATTAYNHWSQSAWGGWGHGGGWNHGGLCAQGHAHYSHGHDHGQVDAHAASGGYDGGAHDMDCQGFVPDHDWNLGDTDLNGLDCLADFDFGF